MSASCVLCTLYQNVLSVVPFNQSTLLSFIFSFLSLNSNAPLIKPTFVNRFDTYFGSRLCINFLIFYSSSFHLPLHVTTIFSEYNNKPLPPLFCSMYSLFFTSALCNNSFKHDMLRSSLLSLLSLTEYHWISYFLQEPIKLSPVYSTNCLGTIIHSVLYIFISHLLRQAIWIKHLFTCYKYSLYLLFKINNTMYNYDTEYQYQIQSLYISLIQNIGINSVNTNFQFTNTLEY